MAEGDVLGNNVKLQTDEKEKAAAPAESGDGIQDSKTSASTSQSAIPKELLVKHPLQSKWVLWYLKNDKNKAWEDCLKKVATFDTVEDFWALYNHIQLSSSLDFGSDYSLFKDGIQPTWEDKENVEGGRWLIAVDRNARQEVLDHYWLELLMAVIGEQFDDLGEEICGCIINVRPKGDKISVWLKNADNDEKNLRIGQIIKQKLGVGEKIKFETHDASKNKRSSAGKHKLII